MAPDLAADEELVSFWADPEQDGLDLSCQLLLLPRRGIGVLGGGALVPVLAEDALGLERHRSLTPLNELDGLLDVLYFLLAGHEPDESKG